MIPFLDAIAAAGMEFFTRLGRAVDEKRTGFSDYEAGDFLAAGGRMECDGPDAAAPGGADLRLDDDPAELLREAADYVAAVAPVCDATYVRQLAAGLRDLAAQFDADEHPTT